MARPLPQPSTFPEHTNGYFWCWCIPTYTWVVDNDGDGMVAVLHMTAEPS